MTGNPISSTAVKHANAQILLQHFHGQNVITISYTKNNKNNNTKICVFRLLARLGIRPARVSSQNSYQCFAFPQFSIPQYLIKYPPRHKSILLVQIITCGLEFTMGSWK